jgi:hypothetical protein
VPVFKVSATDDAFSIPALEPDGQPIIFSFSAAGDAGLAVNPPTGMTMTPAGVVTWDKATLAPGLYVAQVTMTDSVGGSTTADLLFEIVAALAPLALDRTTLWSPNHFLVTIEALNTDASACRVSSILSSEPINGLGDGDRAPDWQWMPEWTPYRTFNLRAERAADGPGRVYTVTVKCGSGTDASYLMSTVAVPSDNGKK